MTTLHQSNAPMVATTIIDLDAAPFIPESNWSVIEHRKGGKFEWDPTKVRLVFNEDRIPGHELHKRLVPLNPFNANMLDFFLKKENHRLVPEEWKSKNVYFWGTIYGNAWGHCVRFLQWKHYGPCPRFDRLSSDIPTIHYPAVIPA